MPPVFFVWIFYALCRVRCPHRTDIAHKAGYCHPERSEGSLHWYSAENIVFIMFEVQRFFGQGPQNDRVAVCGY